MEDKYDPGFGKSIQWDIPLLEGYEYEWMENKASDSGSHHFKGIDNPGIVASIESWKADAVLVYGWSFKSHLKVMRYFKNKVPVFFRGDSISIGKTGYFKSVMRKVFLKWVYRNIDMALYVGKYNKAYFKSFGLKESQLVFAPHAIDNERFKVNEQYVSCAADFKKKLSIPKDHLVFLYAGKLEEKKNVSLLLDTFSQILDPKVTLLIVGNGPLEQSLKKKFGKYSNIIFIDFQNQRDMPAVYQIADIFVLPSKGPLETWGLSINEAMASGKPVLVSDTCGAAIDLVQNGVNGFIFRSRDEKDLLDKMRKLLEPGTDLQKMGNASLEIIKEWNYEKDCMAIESLFN